MEKSLGTGALGTVVLGAIAPLWPLWGNPPYGYYQFLKVIVAAAAGIGAYALYGRSAYTLPLGVLVGAVGAVHLFGKMQRSQWETWNWIAVGLLLAVACALLLVKAVSPSTPIQAHK